MYSAHRGSRFPDGRKACKWVREGNREMESGPIFARSFALSSNLREFASALGFLRGEMALLGVVTSPLWRTFGSRANRPWRKRNIA